MLTPAEAAGKAVAHMAAEVRRATVFVSPTLVVSVCRRFKHRARMTREDFVMKIGEPNVRQAEFIKACKKAGEPFPIRKVKLDFWPKKRGT